MTSIVIKSFCFSGKLSWYECQYLIRSIATQTCLVKWEIQEQVQFPLQTKDISLDPILPRICSLATNSSDRKTKIAACELIYSIAIYLIGFSGKLSSKAWHNVSSILIDLGCDSDPAVQQMFEPLLFQIVHYLALPNSPIANGIDEFTNLLFDKLSHPTSSTIQDLSAKLIREMLSWTIRHQHMTLSSNKSLTLNNLFSKLKLYSTDSNEQKRKAAVLAFNNIFYIAQKEDKLINEHWIDLYHAFCINYSMTEEFYTINHLPSFLDHHNTALQNLVKVMIRHKSILNKIFANRVVPAEFGTGTLHEVIIWTLRQSNAKQPKYRAKCRQIVIDLLVAAGFEDRRSFVLKTGGSASLVHIFEGLNKQGIARHTTLDKFPENTSVYDILQWFENLLIALEGHIWLAENNLLLAKDVPTVRKNIFAAIQYFVTQLMTMSQLQIFLRYKVKMVEYDSDDRYYLNKIVEVKREIALNILKVLVLLPEACDVLINENFYKVLLEIILKVLFFNDSGQVDFNLEVYNEEQIQFSRDLVVKLLVTKNNYNNVKAIVEAVLKVRL